MGKLKFTFSNILLYLAIIATCLILEGVGIINANQHDSFSNPIFFMLFVLAMGSYLSYFLIEHIKNKASLDYVLVAVLSLCFVGGCLAIWQFEGAILDGVNHYEYLVSYWDKTIQTLSLITYLLAVYSILFYFNKNHPSIRRIKIVYFIIIVFCLYTTVYSWINETDNIIHNLTASEKPFFVKSIFQNPNPYSLFLLLGIFSCFGLNYFKKNVFSYICIFYLGFFICVIASLTAVAVMAASLFIYFFVEIIFTIRKKRGLGIFFLTLYLTVLCSFVVLLACALNYDMGGLSSFLKFLYYNFSIAEYDTMALRTFTWSSSINYIGERPFNLLFGFGFQNSNRIIGGLWNAYRGSDITWRSAHSGYIQALMDFGILGVVALFLFVLYYFYSFCRLLKKDARFALIFICIGFALFGYAVMESIIFLGTGSMGLLIAAFFYLPMMNKWKHYKHQNLGNDVVEFKKPKPMPSSSISKSLAKAFMSLIAVTVSLFVFPLFNSNIAGIYFLSNALVVLVLCALFVPFIVASISKRHSRRAATILSALNFVIVASPIVYMAVRFYLNPSWIVYSAVWLFPTFIFIILFGEVLIFGAAKRQKFKDYLATLVGMSKNSFMGLIGAGIIAFVTFFVLTYLDLESPLTYVIYPVIVLVSFYLASYLVPFKDQKKYIEEYNESLMYSLKMQVLKDRLGDYNEKRRD